MNVFICDPDPRVAARALADRHVVKMPLESTQILCTVGPAILGFQPPGRWYKPTHRGHPCTRATQEDPEYRRWMVLYTVSLFDEYEHRFGRPHASREVFDSAVRALCIDLNAPAPPPTQGWPACPRVVPDTVESYRAVLRRKYAEWGESARWTRSSPPSWLAE